MGLHATIYAVLHIRQLARTAGETGESLKEYTEKVNEFISGVAKDLCLCPWKDFHDIDLLRNAGLIFAYSEGVIK